MKILTMIGDNKIVNKYMQTFIVNNNNNSIKYLQVNMDNVPNG